MSDSKVSRRVFVSSTSLAAGALLLSPISIAQSQQAAPKIPDRGPQIDPALVKEYVIAGHSNLPRTQELLAQHPGLLNASWDWGGGDFETALGGASHMGNKEIANFLISQGARLDIFTLAMLGKLSQLKDILQSYPALAASKGPHGIPLIAHAQKGGEEAVAVVKFLEGLKT